MIDILFVESLSLLYVQGSWAKSMIEPLLLYYILRVTRQLVSHWMLKALQATLADMLQTLAATGSPLACVSNTLNKPSPLRLNVSFPSFNDFSWSLARLIYLFDIQMERNVAT